MILTTFLDTVQKVPKQFNLKRGNNWWLICNRKINEATIRQRFCDFLKVCYFSYFQTNKEVSYKNVLWNVLHIPLQSQTIWQHSIMDGIQMFAALMWSFWWNIGIEQKLYIGGLLQGKWIYFCQFFLFPCAEVRFKAITYLFSYIRITEYLPCCTIFVSRPSVNPFKAV